jgi:hypothetical protein
VTFISAIRNICWATMLMKNGIALRNITTKFDLVMAELSFTYLPGY